MHLIRRCDWHQRPVFWLLGLLVLVGQTLVNLHHASHTPSHGVAQPDSLPVISEPTAVLSEPVAEPEWSHQAGDSVCKIWLGLGVASSLTASALTVSVALLALITPAPSMRGLAHATRARPWPRAPPLETACDRL